ncbi:MAG: four helix bundle protein [Flavobacteriaceae bacterium]|nr:MAG: four helix bundle protein [Flavobacteriaceae bacterium]
MIVKKDNLEGRLVEFASSIVLFSKDLPTDMTGQYYGNQLLRSGGSAALNFGETQGTRTNKDYIYKASLSLKGLKESRVNLKILNKVNYGESSKRALILNETEQLIKIIATSIRNKK